MKPSDNDQPSKDEFEQVVDKLKSAQNILVTVSTDPTVDQFAACIGLTLILNKIGKHANSVFSGKAPSTIDFLKPEKTLEKTTDSLRDFIIALDKSKADKLRYKVEDNVVKIFITPYKTSISEKDLEFSQGDFNIDAVVALGVQDKHHIDQAILSHGRILHDAAVISVNISRQSRIGTINWSDNRASSLCEMVADVAMELDNKVFDSQNSTALLTGIVAETDRYSNDKAAPHTMSVAGLLMSAGASTQLVSSKLSNKKVTEPIPEHYDGGDDGSDDGVLEIDHRTEENKKNEDSADSGSEEELPPPPVDLIDNGNSNDGSDESPEPEIKIDEDGEIKEPTKSETKSKSRIMHAPPEFGSQLTANSEPEENRYSASTDPLSNAPSGPMLSRQKSAGKKLPKIDDDQTLSDIEKAVDSPHLSDNDTVIGSTTPEIKDVKVEDARDAVLLAEQEGEIDNPVPEARQSIGSTELGSDLNSSGSSPESATLDPKAQEDSPPPPVPPPYMPPEV